MFRDVQRERLSAGWVIEAERAGLVGFLLRGMVGHGARRHRERVGFGTAVPSFDAILFALGGGALATGVSHVVKARAPDVEVICVQPLGGPAMTHSWRQRRVVTTDSTSTIADGVAGRRPIPAVLDDLLLVADDAVLVQEASIIAGMRMLLDHAGLVVEPSAALGIAAILEDRDRFAGRHVVTIVCGSNVDLTPITAGSARLPSTGLDNRSPRLVAATDSKAQLAVRRGDAADRGAGTVRHARSGQRDPWPGGSRTDGPGPAA
jgi:Pyridoxal-phosphate dependent enzyme